MSDIFKNYFKFLEVISSLNCNSENETDVGSKRKMSDLQVIESILTAEFIPIDSENSLFKEINKQQIPNLIKRSQFNKRRGNYFYF